MLLGGVQRMERVLKTLMLSAAVLAAVGCASQRRVDTGGPPLESPLVITGEVSEVRRLAPPNASSVAFEVPLILHFANRGTEPLLLFVDGLYPWLYGPLLAKTREDALGGIFVFSESMGLSCDQEGWARTRLQLQKRRPPPGFIRRIAPGEAWAFEEIVYLYIDYEDRFDRSNRPWAEIRQEEPLWLRLNYGVWPNNFDSCGAPTVLGDRLESRWRKDGQLLRGTVLSEPIPIQLPNDDTPPEGNTRRGQSRLWGRVWDDKDQPANGAKITVTGPKLPEPRVAYADSMGMFLFSDLPPGPGYKVLVEYQGAPRAARDGLDLPPHFTEIVHIGIADREPHPQFSDPPPLVDRRSTSGGIVVEINPKTGEPEPHPR